MQTDQLIADLEKGLAAAKELAAQTAAPPAGEPDTPQMPGGVDSAPVNEPDPSPGAESELAKIEHTAEVEGIDILEELKAGTHISDIANKLLDQTGLTSIVKAIGQLAHEVGI